MCSNATGMGVKHSNTLSVFVRGRHGELHTLSGLFCSSRNGELYSQMSAKIGISTSVIRLLLGRRALYPEQTLEQSGITNGSMIHLSVPGYGGGKGKNDIYQEYMKFNVNTSTYMIIIQLMCCLYSYV